MSKILDEEPNLSYRELDRERIRLVNVMRERALNRLDKKTVHEIVGGVDAYRPNTVDEHYFDELALQDPLVVNCGYQPEAVESCLKEILVDHAYSNDEDYRVAHRMFMGTREGFELSQKIALVLLRMMISDEYSTYLESLAQSSSDPAVISSIRQVQKRVEMVRHSSDICNKYNALVKARKNRSFESSLSAPFVFGHEDGEMAFYPTKLYEAKMDIDDLSHAEMAEQRAFLIHDDNAFCQLSHTKRDAKNFCNDILEDFASNVREHFTVDLAFDIVRDAVLQNVA